MTAGDVTLSAGQAAMIAGTIADVVRQRLVFAQLELVAGPGGVDVTAIREQLARVTDAARAAGFWVDPAVSQELKP
jgi:hypothetical protein